MPYNELVRIKEGNLALDWLDALPLAGQYGVIGGSVVLNLLALVLVLRGDLVPLSRVNQWLKAWEVTMQTQEDTAKAAEKAADATEAMVDIVENLTGISETLEHLIGSLPRHD